MTRGVDRGRLAKRVTSVAAIVLCWSALYVLVARETTERARASGETAALQPLATASRALARRLDGLYAADSAWPARRALRAVLKERARIAAALVDADERVTNALDRHAEYLDAVGSILSNPRSPHRRTLLGTAGRARSAYGSLPDDAGLGATIRADQRVLAFSRGRLRGDR